MKNKILIFALMVILIVLALFYRFKNENNGVQTAKYYNPETRITFTTEFIVRNGDTINDGKFFRYNAKGVKIVEGAFVNGEVTGKLTNYFDNGSIKNSFYHKNNKTTLEDTYYNPNGTIKEYEMYDLSGKRAFIIYFDENAVKKHYGYPLMEIYQYRFSHKEQFNVKTVQYLKVGDTFIHEYLVANIPNAKRILIIENLSVDNSKVKRIMIKKPPAGIEVKEVLIKKGINTIRGIVQYRFKNQKSPTINDTILFDINVN